MTHYLIEFRFSGKAKKYLKDLIYDVSQKFNVTGVTRKKPVPHISLAGPLFTKDERRLVKEVFDVVEKYNMVGFFMKGFGKFSKFLFLNRVIYVDIEPSKELEEMRREIAKRLEGFCTLQDHDYKDSFEFHATIAFKDINWKFGEIWKYVQTLEPPKFEQTVLRVTIIKNKKILYEYDLMQKRRLNRLQALDRDTFRKTIENLRKRKEVLPPEFWDVPDSQKDGKIFLISDTHFDHDNIIRYCNRPFRTVDEMNQIIIDKWNSTVKNDDIVYFLGDLTLDPGKLDFWLDKLNGKIKFIRGNHDRGPITRAEEIHNWHPLVYKGNKFLLSHDPIRPANWDGWLIHGDKHNNSLTNYPFINPEKKTINICSEIINYKPISLDEVIQNLGNNEKREYLHDGEKERHENHGHGYERRHDRHEHKYERKNERRHHRYENSKRVRSNRSKAQPPTYYEILGVEKNASIDEIKTAFRKCILRWHSDKNKTEDADEYTKILYEARDVLIDPIKRRQYDKTID